MEDKDSKLLKSTFYFKWIFASLAVLLLLLACSLYSLYSIRKMQESNAENAKRIAELQEQMKLVTESNALTVFGLEQMGEMQRVGDSSTTTDNVLKRKLDSLERQNYHNALMARLEALNASALSKSQDDSKQLYDNYLTHINSILGFFGVLIALITIFVPYLINRKADDAIKEHEEKLKKYDEDQKKISGNFNERVEAINKSIQEHENRLNGIVAQTNQKAEEAKKSTEENLTVSEISSYNIVAKTYEIKGEYDKALDYYKIAMVNCESDLGKDHPYTATTYNNIAGVFRTQGEYEKAMEYYERALIVRKMKLGEAHPYTQDTRLAVQIMKLLLKLGIDEEQLMEHIKRNP